MYNKILFFFRNMFSCQFQTGRFQFLEDGPESRLIFVVISIVLFYIKNYSHKTNIKQYFYRFYNNETKILKSK